MSEHQEHNAQVQHHVTQQVQLERSRQLGRKRQERYLGRKRHQQYRLFHEQHQEACTHQRQQDAEQNQDDAEQLPEIQANHIQLQRTRLLARARQQRHRKRRQLEHHQAHQPEEGYRVEEHATHTCAHAQNILPAQEDAPEVEGRHSVVAHEVQHSENQQSDIVLSQSCEPYSVHDGMRRLLAQGKQKMVERQPSIELNINLQVHRILAPLMTTSSY